MALVYRYSDGTNATSVSGAGPFPGTPWDTGRAGVVARARTTTRQGIYDEIAAALVAAGWTRVVAAGAPNNDDHWFSAGESGTRHICVRTRHTLVGSNRYVEFYVGVKLDAGGLIQAGVGGQSSVIDRLDTTTADYTSDFHIVGDLDSMWFVFQNVNHSGSMLVAMVGELIPVDLNTNVMITSGALTAGEQVQIAVTGNPIALGYRALDPVQIINVAAAGVARAETQIITRVTSSSIYVRQLGQAYDAGARVGAAPMMTSRLVSNNTELDTIQGVVSNVVTPLMHDRLNRTSDLAVDNALPNGQIMNQANYALLRSWEQTASEFGSGTTGNNRTLRFTARTIAVGVGGRTWAGRLPRLLSYPGTPVYYPHDYGRYDRVTPAQDFVPFRFTSISARHYMLGSTPG